MCHDALWACAMRPKHIFVKYISFCIAICNLFLDLHECLTPLEEQGTVFEGLRIVKKALHELKNKNIHIFIR